MNNEIILMSHGFMAEEMLNSANMILGNQINYPVVSMESNDGIDGTLNKLDKVLDNLHEVRNIVILVDLMGGTPSNVAMMRASTDSRIHVLTGMNLGMILESFFSIEKENLVDHLSKTGNRGIQIPQLQVIEE